VRKKWESELIMESELDKAHLAYYEEVNWYFMDNLDEELGLVCKMDTFVLSD